MSVSVNWTLQRIGERVWGTERRWEVEKRSDWLASFVRWSTHRRRRLPDPSVSRSTSYFPGLLPLLFRPIRILFPTLFDKVIRVCVSATRILSRRCHSRTRPLAGMPKLLETTVTFCCFCFHFETFSVVFTVTIFVLKEKIGNTVSFFFW